MRQEDARIRVPPQEVERPSAGRLVEGLGAQVGGADRIRFKDDRVATQLVASDREGETEREQQRDHAQQAPCRTPIDSRRGSARS